MFYDQKSRRCIKTRKYFYYCIYFEHSYHQAGESVKSVFPKDTTEWHEWVLNQDHVDHKHGTLTTRPCC